MLWLLNLILLDSDKLTLSDLNPIFQKFDQLENDITNLSLRFNLDQEKGDLKAVENVLSMHFEQNRKYDEEIKALKSLLLELKLSNQTDETKSITGEEVVMKQNQIMLYQMRNRKRPKTKHHSRNDKRKQLVITKDNTTIK